MVLDATVGGSAANSYLSVATADLLNADRLGSFADAWTAASTVTKEKALMQATADIDAFVRPGAVWDDDQLLLFPRLGDVDASAVPYLPSRVRQATYEQAVYLLVNVRFQEDAATRRARGMFSFNENDGLSGSIAIDGQLGLLAPRAEALLTAFVGTAGGGYIGSMRVKSAMLHAAANASE